MTIHITKFKAALALVVVALLVPVTAIATHTFSDVPDGRYYTDAVEWAAENEITTGTSATTFSPEDAVTRGQNVTFAYRYDQNIVQPALTELESLFPIARSAGSTDNVDEDEPRTQLLSVEIEAPVPGIIQLNGFVRVNTGAFSGVNPGTVLCYFDLSGIDVPDELLLEGEIYYTGEATQEVTCPVTAALTVEAGTHTVLMDAEAPETAYFDEYQMNALFVPLGSNEFVEEEPVILSK